jgi:hypothetical protein
VGLADGALLTQPPPNFGFIYVSESGQQAFSQEATRNFIATSLAKTWLPYGQGPGSGALTNPMAQLPDYAAAVSMEGSQGMANRERAIRDALKRVPPSGGRQPAKQAEMSADESLLFFYGLEDQYGREHLHAALRHMVQARRGQGYEVQDLIAALEQETHQEVGTFFRLWLKHSGVPEGFRARYEAPAVPKNAPEENQK